MIKKELSKVYDLDAETQKQLLAEFQCTEPKLFNCQPFDSATVASSITCIEKHDLAKEVNPPSEIKENPPPFANQEIHYFHARTGVLPTATAPEYQKELVLFAFLSGDLEYSKDPLPCGKAGQHTCTVNVEKKESSNEYTPTSIVLENNEEIKIQSPLIPIPILPTRASTYNKPNLTVVSNLTLKSFHKQYPTVAATHYKLFLKNLLGSLKDHYIEDKIYNYVTNWLENNEKESSEIRLAKLSTFFEVQESKAVDKIRLINIEFRKHYSLDPLKQKEILEELQKTEPDLFEGKVKDLSYSTPRGTDSQPTQKQAVAPTFDESALKQECTTYLNYLYQLLCLELMGEKLEQAPLGLPETLETCDPVLAKKYEIVQNLKNNYSASLEACKTFLAGKEQGSTLTRAEFLSKHRDNFLVQLFKFLRDVIYSIGATAPKNPYRSDTFPFWKSHGEVFIEKAMRDKQSSPKS